MRQAPYLIAQLGLINGNMDGYIDKYTQGKKVTEDYEEAIQSWSSELKKARNSMMLINSSWAEFLDNVGVLGLKVFNNSVKAMSNWGKESKNTATALKSIADAFILVSVVGATFNISKLTASFMGLSGALGGVGKAYHHAASAGAGLKMSLQAAWAMINPLTLGLIGAGIAITALYSYQKRINDELLLEKAIKRRKEQEMKNEIELLKTQYNFLQQHKKIYEDLLKFDLAKNWENTYDIISVATDKIKEMTELLEISEKISVFKMPELKVDTKDLFSESLSIINEKYKEEIENLENENSEFLEAIKERDNTLLKLSNIKALGADKSDGWFGNLIKTGSELISGGREHTNLLIRYNTLKKVNPNIKLVEVMAELEKDAQDEYEAKREKLIKKYSKFQEATLLTTKQISTELLSGISGDFKEFEGKSFFEAISLSSSEDETNKMLSMFEELNKKGKITSEEYKAITQVVKEKYKIEQENLEAVNKALIEYGNNLDRIQSITTQGKVNIFEAYVKSEDIKSLNDYIDGIKKFDIFTQNSANAMENLELAMQSLGTKTTMQDLLNKGDLLKTAASFDAITQSIKYMETQLDVLNSKQNKTEVDMKLISDTEYALKMQKDYAETYIKSIDYQEKLRDATSFYYNDSTKQLLKYQQVGLKEIELIEHKRKLLEEDSKKSKAKSDFDIAQVENKIEKEIKLNNQIAINNREKLKSLKEEKVELEDTIFAYEELYKVSSPEIQDFILGNMKDAEIKLQEILDSIKTYEKYTKYINEDTKTLTDLSLKSLLLEKKRYENLSKTEGLIKGGTEEKRYKDVLELITLLIARREEENEQKIKSKQLDLEELEIFKKKAELISELSKKYSDTIKEELTLAQLQSRVGTKSKKQIKEQIKIQANQYKHRSNILNQKIEELKLNQKLLESEKVDSSEGYKIIKDKITALKEFIKNAKVSKELSEEELENLKGQLSDLEEIDKRIKAIADYRFELENLNKNNLDSMQSELDYLNHMLNGEKDEVEIARLKLEIAKKSKDIRLEENKILMDRIGIVSNLVGMMGESGKLFGGAISGIGGLFAKDSKTEMNAFQTMLAGGSAGLFSGLNIGMTAFSIADSFWKHANAKKQAKHEEEERRLSIERNRILKASNDVLKNSISGMDYKSLSSNIAHNFSREFSKDIDILNKIDGFKNIDLNSIEDLREFERENDLLFQSQDVYLKDRGNNSKFTREEARLNLKNQDKYSDEEIERLLDMGMTKLSDYQWGSIFGSTLSDILRVVDDNKDKMFSTLFGFDIEEVPDSKGEKTIGYITKGWNKASDIVNKMKDNALEGLNEINAYLGEDFVKTTSDALVSNNKNIEDSNKNLEDSYSKLSERIRVGLEHDESIKDMATDEKSVKQEDGTFKQYDSIKTTVAEIVAEAKLLEEEQEKINGDAEYFKKLWMEVGEAIADTDDALSDLDNSILDILSKGLISQDSKSIISEFGSLITDSVTKEFRDSDVINQSFKYFGDLVKGAIKSGDISEFAGIYSNLTNNLETLDAKSLARINMSPKQIKELETWQEMYKIINKLEEDSLNIFQKRDKLLQDSVEYYQEVIDKISKISIGSKETADLWSKEMNSGVKKVKEAINEANVLTKKIENNSKSFLKEWITDGNKVSDIIDMMSDNIKGLYNSTLEFLDGENYVEASTKLGSDLASSLIKSYQKELLDQKYANQFMILSDKFGKALTSGSLSNIQSLNNEIQKFAVATEQERLRFDAIRDLFSLDNNIAYNQADQNITYETGSTKSNVYNYYNTVDITGTFIADKVSVRKLTEEIVKFLPDSMKNNNVR